MKYTSMVLILCSQLALAESNYQVIEVAKHIMDNKGKIRASYQFTVKNNTEPAICEFALSDVLDEASFFEPGKPTTGAWPEESLSITGSSSTNWLFQATPLQESNQYAIEWDAPDDSNTDKCILAGQQATFSFTAPQAKPYFSRGYAWVNGNKVAVNVLDKTPPSLHIYLSDNDPQLRWRDRATLRVRVEVKDNLDPNPQIQLERITMTRRVLPGQVVQATPTPVRDGDVITLQRIPLAEYQLTFSAMDASYNRVSFVRKVQIKLLGQGVLIM